MTPDRNSEDLEQEFLELQLRQELSGVGERDLAASVREAYESGASGEKGNDMSTLAIPIEGSQPERASIWNQRLLVILANAACIIFVLFLARSFFTSDDRSDDQDPTLAMVTDQDEDESTADHDEAEPVRTVRNMSDVRSLPPGTTEVICNGMGISDELFISLCKLHPNLQALTVRDSQVTALGMASLPELKKLSWLALPGNECINRQGWEVVGKLKGLTHLDVGRFMGQKSSFVNPGTPGFGFEAPADAVDPGPFLIDEICSLPRLKSLNLTGHRMDDQDLARLISGAGTNLERLDLSHTQITGSGLTQLAACRRLKQLAVVDVDHENAKTLEYLATLNRVESLKIGINGMSSITYDSERLAGLGRMPNLRRLELTSVNIQPGQFEVLSTLRNLKVLHLNYCFGVTDQGCAQLAQMEGLTQLGVINGRGTTSQGLSLILDGTVDFLDLRGSFGKLEAAVLKKALDARPRLLVRVWNDKALKDALKSYVRPGMTESDMLLRKPMTEER